MQASLGTAGVPEGKENSIPQGIITKSDGFLVVGKDILANSSWVIQVLGASFYF